MSERIARLDPETGDVAIIALETAVSELATAGLFGEIAPRLREGQLVRLENGRRYRALAALDAFALEPLPPSVLS